MVPGKTRAKKGRGRVQSSTGKTNKAESNVDARSDMKEPSRPKQIVKRKRSESDDLEADTTAKTNKVKRAKTSPIPPKHQARGRPAKPKPQPPQQPIALPIINQIPDKTLTVFVFGGGENGELGLGPKRNEALRPCLNPSLDPNSSTAYHIVTYACGGMHTIALSTDNKIVTWGVNDNNALGRDIMGWWIARHGCRFRR